MGIEIATSTVVEESREGKRLFSATDSTAVLVGELRQIDAVGPSLSVDKSGLRVFDVESHLNQAADLLDRAGRARATYDDLAAKCALVQLELSDFAGQDEIHRDEEAAGYYTLASSGANDEAVIAEEELGRASSAVNSTREALEATLLSYEAQLDAVKLGAWLTGTPSYGVKNGPDLVIYNGINWNGRTAEARQHAEQSASSLFERRFFVEKAGLDSQFAVLGHDYQVSFLRNEQAKRVKEWQSHNVDFRRRRMAALRRLFEVKLRVATDKDGALNYTKRMNGLRAQFKFDLEQALQRIEVAAEGLRTIYEIDTTPPIGADDDALDRATIWVREQIQRLIRFMGNDQATVLSVSVRRLTGEIAWAVGKQSGEWTFDVARLLAQRPWRHVRLRGLSVSIDAKSTLTPQVVDVTVPRVASTNGLGGSVTMLDQSAIPTCTAGRAFHVSSSQSPDVVGIQALNNSSPLGIWSVRMPLGFDESVEDVIIAVHLAYRQAPEAPVPVP